MCKNNLFLGALMATTIWGVAAFGVEIPIMSEAPPMVWTMERAEMAWTVEVGKTTEYDLMMQVDSENNVGVELDLFIDDQFVQTVKVNPKKGWKQFQPRAAVESVPLTAGTHRFQLIQDSFNKKVRLHVQQVQLVAEVDSRYEKQSSFAQTLVHMRENGIELSMKQLWADFPHEMCWFTQDAADADQARMDPEYDYAAAVRPYFDQERDNRFEKQLIQRVLSEVKDVSIAAVEYEPGDVQALELYMDLCRKRRAQRLQPLLEKTQRIVFAKHQVFGSISGIYNITETEGLHFGETSALCMLDLAPEAEGGFAKEKLLKDAEGGILRDPVLSSDAKRMLFAWRKDAVNIYTKVTEAPDSGNYQIYEMELASGETRQLTTDETYGANYEPCYLPNGDIMFNSARIVQHITCGWGDHSNLFVMNKDGKYQRRVGFDQVSSQFPMLLNNGQVIYLRRDYNDRGQTAAHALFVMNPDGTGQTEYYGNQTGTPNSFMHAAPIPGSSKVVCVLSGYHTRQGGQLALIDIREGRNHGEGIVEIPQGTQPKAEPHGKDDGYGKKGVQYANPFALSETEYIVCRSETWSKSARHAGRGEHYGIYLMTADGRRELLMRDPINSCLQPVAVMPRAPIPARSSMVDYTKDTGTYYIQNAYLGAAAEGIKDKIKKIRVIEILYKHDTMQPGTASGPGGGTATVTAPAHPLALFDAKKILGEATVYEDGSAMFEVPARTPVYFQLLDEKNRCLQTMRSWSTLMPGERFSCVGCHEDKNQTPVGGAKTMAMAKGVEKLKPFYGEARGFSYLKEVQPIFDKHCVSCHHPEGKGQSLVLTEKPYSKYGRNFAESYVNLMAARPGPDPSKYNVKGGPDKWKRSGPAKEDEPNPYVQYWTRLDSMPFKPPYYAGAITSGMIKRLEEGHEDVKLSQEEWDKLVAWIDLNCPYTGDYMEANAWKSAEAERYRSRIEERKRNEAIDAQHVQAYIEAGQP